MKLLRARIENFRLLREIEFCFSIDIDRNLTVIRAANESGKTTLLTALQWGLFGDEALPEHGKNYRLSPIKNNASQGSSIVTISVEVDCELPYRTGVRQYRLIRSVTETVNGGNWKRSSTDVHLYHLTSRGAEQLDNAEAHIRPHLPKELREVFFTDGDRALSFIEGSRNDQMKRVEGAIRSLLGFVIIEEGLKHTSQVIKDINQKVRATGNRTELEKVSERIALLQEEIPIIENQFNVTKHEYLKLEDLEQDADKKLTDALRKGNKDELERHRQDIKQRWIAAEKDADQASKDHANLFRSDLLGRQLLANPFRSTKIILDRLHAQGKIPNQTIPVLEDRLLQPTCICGESLDPKTPDGYRRRENIQRLIHESQSSDEIQRKVTALYYSAQELLKTVSERNWESEYKEVFSRRDRANKRLQKLGAEEREIEARIAKLPDIDIQQLKMTRDHYKREAIKFRDKNIRLSSQLESKSRELKAAEIDRDKLLQQDEKGMKLVCELTVAEDLRDILSNSLEAMKTRELELVSQRMNNLFLEMIGADDGERSIITKTEITPDFRIIVYGRDDHPLNPSQDLNGASRRALTIAFILALTKVSEVEAPNVIDTPLGMMSGYVKQTVLKLASQQSSQLVLFLTHDEIVGCQDILNTRAGRIYTITNPAHYPKILLNDPGVTDIGVILCECDHNQHCTICERRAGATLENNTVTENV